MTSLPVYLNTQQAVRQTMFFVEILSGGRGHTGYILQTQGKGLQKFS